MRMKSAISLGAVALTAILSLSACGGTSDDSKKDTDATSTTRVVTDASGTEVTVPTEPKRVIAMSEQDLDAALALGVTPVGAVNGRGQKGPSAYLADRAEGVESVGDMGQPATDTIVELEPDLILYGGVFDEALLDQVRELVPATVVTYKLDDDWKTAFEGTADALNLTDEATTWLADYDTTVATAQETLGDHVGETVSIIRWNPDGPAILQNEAFSSLVIQDLGLVRPDGQQEAGYAHSDPLSLENLPRIDADWIFVGTLVPGSEEALAEATSKPAFKGLEAVKNDHFIEVDGSLWTSRGGPLAALDMINQVTETLTK